MGRTSKNIKLRIPEKPHKIKGFRSGSYRVATTISSQPRYDHFDTSPRCIFKALRVSVRLRAECRNRRTKRRKTVDIQLLKSVDNPEKPEISRVFGDGPSTDLLDFECCKTLADSRLEQVVSGCFVKRPETQVLQGVADIPTRIGQRRFEPPQSSNKTAFLRKKSPFLRVCKKPCKKTETLQRR